MKSTTLAPNEWKMVMALWRSALRCASQAGSPTCTQRPSRRWSVTSQRPSPRATTWGRCSPAPAATGAPAHTALCGGPDGAGGDDLQLGVEVAPDRGIVGHRGPVGRTGVLRTGPYPASWRWSRRGSGGARGARRRHRPGSGPSAQTPLRPSGSDCSTRAPPSGPVADARTPDVVEAAAAVASGASRHTAPSRQTTPPKARVSRTHHGCHCPPRRRSAGLRATPRRGKGRHPPSQSRPRDAPG